MIDFKIINSTILETFSILKNSPSMILADTSNYLYLQNYIEGYIDALSNVLNKNLRFEINNWYKNKLNIQTTYHWTCHIQYQFKDKTDNELKNILLNITQEYFMTNPLK